MCNSYISAVQVLYLKKLPISSPKCPKLEYDPRMLSDKTNTPRVEGWFDVKILNKEIDTVVS